MNTNETVNTATATKPVKTKKRFYTKRGTSVAAKRIILLDGKIVGRGRPAKLGKGKRTVVYVPVGQEYNPLVHGTGTAYRAGRQGVLRRLKVEALAAATAKGVDATPAPVDTAPIEAPAIPTVDAVESVTVPELAVT